ncbi:hypothetical protein DPMN_099810 [Dreissena polymorpha]|uniref:Uncharacterized protein n=1 Tax=Dreissena polymorpha TaxID=45954 RepID=A0A9D4R8I9_DREPO|nr:hypothetical protein DPMN_099810 [Dreissena polymorpha]
MKSNLAAASYVCSTAALCACGNMLMLTSAHVVYRKSKPTGAAPTLWWWYSLRCAGGDPR